MSTASTIGLILFSILGILLIVSGAAKLTLSLIKRPLEERIAAIYHADQILLSDLTANNFGLESWGVFQGRGNGALVLTKNCLHFFRFIKGGDVRIPLESITDVSFTKSHLGKATIYNLLKVQFVTEGKRDSIAWYLADSDTWKNTINNLIAQPGN